MLIRRLSVLTSVLLGMLAAASLTAGSAMAHAGLVGSDPSEGGVITADTEQVSFTFNEDINPDLAVVTLTGPEGAQTDLEPPVVNGAEVMQPIPELAAGAFTVAYRVVSADGHPVQGTLSVTAEGTAPETPAQEAPAQEAPAQEPSAQETTAAVVPEPTSPASTSDEGFPAYGWWIGAAAAAAVVVGGVLWRRPAS